MALSTSHQRAKRHWPKTIWLGLSIVAGCQLVILTIELPRRGWVVIPTDHPLPQPDGLRQSFGRMIGRNMTPLCWIGYLFVFDGLLTLLGRRRGDPGISSIRARPNRFIFAWLTSIPVWCFFDWINFYYIHAWYYHGLPPHPLSRYPGYFIAFAAINPGMFMAAQWLSCIGMGRVRTAGIRIPLAIQIACLSFGLACLAYPLIVAAPIGSLTLWVSLIFLLDPINHWLGAPSIIGDWRTGRWGRTLALMAGGAVCGFCWEWWNYWALSKWTYDLSFIGALAEYRYFEMPWLGFIGFLPFAIECWVVLNTFQAVAERLGLRVADPLPDSTCVF